MTAVMASSTGTAAATSAPNVRTRMTSMADIESDISRACSAAKCSLTSASRFEPNWPIVTPGWRSATRSTAALTGASRSPAVSGSPLTWNSTSAERPSSETLPPASGETTSATTACDETAWTTSAIARRTSGSCTVASLVCTRTISPPRAAGNPARSSTCSARRLSPSARSAVVGFFGPSPLPSAKATRMNASHPTIAVLRWRALQRPARAAMPPLSFRCIANLLESC